MKPMSGYIMVDATGLDVSDTEAQTVNGLFDRLEMALSTGKQILLTGVVSGENPCSPVAINCDGDTSFSISMPGFSATVAFTDVVTPVSDEPTP